MTNKKNTLGKLIQYFSYTLVLLNSVGAMEGALSSSSGYHTPPPGGGYSTSLRGGGYHAVETPLTTPRGASCSNEMPFTPPPRVSRNAITAALSTPPPAPRKPSLSLELKLLNDSDRDEIQDLILLLFNENIRTLRTTSRGCDVSTPIPQLSGLPLSQYLVDAEGLYALQQEVNAFFENLRESPDSPNNFHNCVRKMFIALQQDNPRDYESYFDTRRDELGSRVPLMGNLGNAKIFRRVCETWLKSRNKEGGATCGSIGRFNIPNDLPSQPPAWPGATIIYSALI